jgi:hypothetical protein
MNSVRRSSRSLSGRLALSRKRITGIVVGSTLLLGSAMAIAPAAADAFSMQGFFAANCKAGHSTCGEGPEEVKLPNLIEAEEGGFTQAGGYVPFGLTDFRINTEEAGGVKYPEGFPLGIIKSIRTDVAPGVVTNPFAIPMCSHKDFTGTEVSPGVFTEPTCPKSSIIGENKVFTLIEPSPGTFANAHLIGTVYNVEPTKGLASLYGVSIIVAEPSPGVFLVVHTLIEGSVDWSTNYHDYFVIHPAPGLIQSRLIFFGNKENPKPEGSAKFIRNPTSCTPPGAARTTTLRLEDLAGQQLTTPYESLIGTTGCAALTFEPSFALKPETAVADEPDGITTETISKHPASAAVPDSSDLKNAVITLPPGMTMNPAAAAGLEGCTPAQIGAGVTNGTPFLIAPLFPVSCPSRSKVGTFSLEVPTLPEGTLNGNIYLGKPASTPIEGPPYTIYLAAESPRYGILVRLLGTVTPNPVTGQLTTTFRNVPGGTFNNPESPFNNLTMHFNSGPYAPIANPISCGTSASTTEFVPFSTGPSVLGASPFTTTGCAAPQFAAPPLSQSVTAVPNTAATESTLTFTLTRPQGQQYVSQMSTVLPPGISAKIPSVPRCPEALANAGTCPAASLIGTVHIASGSGEPFSFNGNAYLTEHYEGAPYGLSIVVPTKAGPFNFGPIVSRAKITVNPSTAQVSVSLVKSIVQGATVSGVPTIVGGIPTRIREITVAVTHPNYILTPTNCAVLRSESLLVSTLGATATVPSPFQVEGCGSLEFTPQFSASTNGKTSRANGASLGVNITQPDPQANIQSVVTTLPKQLPSRLTTLQKACLLATFEANPFNCPKESNVGTATAVTPTLPDKMSGPAYIVSRGAAFPDLEILLEADGVRVILDGKTDIKNSITTSSFLSNPDVPISSFSLNLPEGKFSLLAANGDLCKPKLVMPTTITGWNGKTIKQNTSIKPTGCLPILKHKVKGHDVTITAKVPQAGRVRFSGEFVGIETRFPRRSQNVTVTLPLTPAGLYALRHRGNRLKVTLRVGFIPRAHRTGQSFTSYATVTFR